MGWGGRYGMINIVPDWLRNVLNLDKSMTCLDNIHIVFSYILVLTGNVFHLVSTNQRVIENIRFVGTEYILS